MNETRSFEAIVQLDRGGDLTASEAVTRAKRVALAYGLSVANVVMEPLLTGQEDRFRLLILARNPLQDVLTYPGPSLDVTTGRIHIGMHADSSPAYWQLWRPGWGACHGMIAGTTGAGKSALLQVLLTEARHSGLIVPWLFDPDNGSNAWKDHVGVYAGSLPRIRSGLQALEWVMQDRMRRWSMEKTVDADGAVTRRDTSQFTPTPAEPLHMGIVDESPEVLADPECRRIIGRIGKRGRKWGVAIVIVTQIPSLAELGGELAVRSMLSSVNVVMFRTGDKLSAQMGSLIPVDPHTLPEHWPDGSTTAGLAYMGTGDRMASLRGFWVPDGHDWNVTGEPAVFPAEDFRAGCGRRNPKRSFLATWRDLLDVPVEDEDGDDENANMPPVRASRPAPAPVTTVEPTARAAILSFLRAHGIATTGVIAQHLDVPLPTVSSALGRMDGREVVKVRHGMWAAAEEATPEQGAA